MIQWFRHVRPSHNQRYCSEQCRGSVAPGEALGEVPVSQVLRERHEPRGGDEGGDGKQDTAVGRPLEHLPRPAGERGLAGSLGDGHEVSLDVVV